MSAVTIYGWDASNHDWGRGPMDVAAALADGISFMTHKVAEGSPGWYIDPYFDDWWARALAARGYARRNLGFDPLLGAYYVNHGGDQIAQADFFLSQLDSRAPGWRDLPAFTLQLDAEWFPYMDRAPTPAENRAFCDRLVARTSEKYRPVIYGPGWLYGTALAGLGYPLWESDYGANPTVHYRSAYPGDGSARWLYGTGVPADLLQYGSRLTIGRQVTCDANAYRGTLGQLKALVMGDDMPLETPDFVGIWTHDLQDGPDTEMAYKAVLRAANDAGGAKTLAAAAANTASGAKYAAEQALAAANAAKVAAEQIAMFVQQPVTDEQLERVLRKIMGGVDGATPLE